MQVLGEINAVMRENDELLRRVRRKQRERLQTFQQQLDASEAATKETRRHAQEMHKLVGELDALSAELARTKRERDRLKTDLHAAKTKPSFKGGTGSASTEEEMSRLRTWAADIERERDDYKAALRTVESGGKKEAQELIQKLIEGMYEKESQLERHKTTSQTLAQQVVELESQLNQLRLQQRE